MVFRVYADFHQFYVEDATANPLATAQPEFWTQEAFEAGLAVAPDLLGVGTARYGWVQVEVEVRNERPDNDLFNWDQVNDAALKVPSGKLRVRGCTEEPDGAATLDVEPGLYRARVFYGNLDVENVDAEEGADFYRVVLWRDHNARPGFREVLKRFELPVHEDDDWGSDL